MDKMYYAKMVPDININDLPYEILIEIFSYLRVEDLALSVRKVCRKWEELSEDNKLWRHLTFHSSFQYSDDQIFDVLKQAPKLQRFHPPLFTSREHLLTVAEHCKDLRQISFSVDHDGDVIDKLVSECQNIEDFTLFSLQFTDTKVFKTVSKCQKLKKLRISGDIAEGNINIFAYISQGCPSLDTLDLRCLTNYSNDHLGSFLKQKKDKILSLFLNCCRPRQTCSLPMIFELCPKLQSLHVTEHAGTVSSEELVSLKKMQNLKALSMEHFVLYEMNHVGDYFRSHYARNLVCISLCEFFLSVEELCTTIFTNCMKLQCLDLSYCENLTDDSLRCIGNLKQLRNLLLTSCCLLTDEGVSHIVRCKQISYLNLNGCGNISHYGFVLLLENLKALKDLFLSACRMEPHSITRVPQELRNLRTLEIRKSEEREMRYVISVLRKKVPCLKIL